jgi:hypothetical protein
MRAAPIFIIIAAFALGVQAQHSFEINNASKYFNVKVDASKCDSNECTGPTTFAFLKKDALKPYQVITLPETYIDISPLNKLPANTAVPYDEQSVLRLDDFNFDGMDDIALCNGRNGSYGASSYDIFLSDRRSGKFIRNRAMTGIADRLSMFDVLKDKKLLETFDKSGCCWHIVQRYKVVGNRPVLIFEEVEDAMNGERVKTTTKALVSGRWKKTVKYSE